MTEGPQDVSEIDLKNLLGYALENVFKSKENDVKSESILHNCIRLFSKDYKYCVVNNNNGELCSHYPSKIVILEYEVSEANRNTEGRVESFYDVNQLKELFNKAKIARCRSRFVVPVILYEGKHICRSATISGGVEIYSRSGLDFFITGGENIPHPEGEVSQEASEWQLFNRLRKQDIKLMRMFSVTHIIDLMVEKKKVKFGLNVTSSEKVDKESRYSDFNILSVPYPGCEFFKEWKDSGYMAEGLKFDWNQSYVDAKIDLPGTPSPPRTIDWSKYRSWDLVKLTQNYLLLLLHYVQEVDTGLLVHCISGWDRTPLYISLLRMSLWADGVIHKSLSAPEMLYLVIAYDWFLFGHDFPDRIAKGEEIFFFCFNFLKYITADEYSVKKKRCRSWTSSRTDSECNIDGVLLEGTRAAGSYKGSNTSINSVSSLNSTKSSIDNAPIFFSTTGSSVSSVDDESFTSISVSNGAVYMSRHHNNHMPRGSDPRMSDPRTADSRGTDSRSERDSGFSTRASGSSELTPPKHVTTSTSPVTVPLNKVHHNDQNNSSPILGSWQMVSGPGSLRGSASSHESPHPDPQDVHSNTHSGLEDSTRKQKLDSLRILFMNVYTSLYKPPTANEGAFSTLFGQFAKNVGIRGNKNTAV